MLKLQPVPSITLFAPVKPAPTPPLVAEFARSDPARTPRSAVGHCESLLPANTVPLKSTRIVS